MNLIRGTLYNSTPTVVLVRAILYCTVDTCRHVKKLSMMSLLYFLPYLLLLIINDTLARSLEPVVTECKEHTIHTQTQIVASRKPKEIKHTHEGEANFTT